MALPEKVSLADVFAHVFVSPAEASHMLQTWAREHSGGAQPDLANKLNQAASETTDPTKYQEEPETAPVP